MSCLSAAVMEQHRPGDFLRSKFIGSWFWRWGVQDGLGAQAFTASSCAGGHGVVGGRRLGGDTEGGEGGGIGISMCTDGGMRVMLHLCEESPPM